MSRQRGAAAAGPSKVSTGFELGRNRAAGFKTVVSKLLVAGFLLIILSGGNCVEPNPVAFPDWIEQGPTSLFQGQVEGIPNRPVTGAISALAPHPTNSNVLYAGSVNGGIWKTENATHPSPQWEPQTDGMPSLSIGDIEFDPLDDSALALFASTASVSSLGGTSGPLVGVYRTVDGGASWEVAASTGLVGLSVPELVALPVVGDDGKRPILLAGTPGGVYRSSDVGENFTLVLAGRVTSLIGDPLDPVRAYAATPGTVGNEIFSTQDAGVTWTSLGRVHALPIACEIKLAIGSVQTQTGEPPLYVTAVPGTPVPPPPPGAPPPPTLTTCGPASADWVHVYRSSDRGVTWTTMLGPLTSEISGAVGPFPGGQARRHFSLAAHPRDPSRVYLGGDRQTTSVIASGSGTSDFSGRIFEGVTSLPTDYVWRPIVGGNVNNTSPHADSRRIVFDSDENLLEADDGGIYRLRKPLYDRWESVIGNLRVTEMVSVAWDSINQIAFGGTQDVGSVEQAAAGGLSTGIMPPWRDIRLLSFLNQDLVNGVGDGGSVAADNRTIPGESIRYTMGNNHFMFFRRNFETSNPAVVPQWLDLPAGLVGSDAALPANGLFRWPFVLNTIHPQWLAAGWDGIYVTQDQGNSWAVREPALGDGLRVSALRFGGVDSSKSQFPELLVLARGSTVSARSSTDATLTQRTLGGRVTALALDPADWRTTFAVTSTQVFRIDFMGTAGEVVVDITGNLQDISSSLLSLSGNSKNIDLRTVEAVRAGDSLVLVAGGMNGVYRLQEADSAGADAEWLRFGTGLPNLNVFQVIYDPTDDVLVAATLGRGVWLVPEAATALTAAPFLRPFM